MCQVAELNVKKDTPWQRKERRDGKGSGVEEKKEGKAFEQTRSPIHFLTS